MMLIIIGLILTLSQTPLGVNLDSIGAFVLACFLLLLAYSSAAKTSTNLVEATLSERLQNIASGESEEFFNEKMKLFGIFPYNLRGVYYIDFQVKFLDEQNLADVQELSRKIQFNVQLKIPHAVVNVIPVKGE